MSATDLAGALAEPALVAETPSAWLSEHLARRYALDADHPDDPGEPGRARPGWMGLVELVEAGVIGEVHGRLVAEGTPPKVASTYLAGWVGGALADAVGFGLAAGAAGFTPSAEDLRVHVRAAGWVDAVDLGSPPTVVASGHPWAGRPGVEDASPAEVLDRSVGALVEVAAPVVEACRSLASVGRTGLWNEVGDALGAAVAYQHAVAPTPSMLAVLDAAVRVDGAPWRATPSLRFVRSELLGPVHVAQKGGCCLAYTADRPASDDEELDDDLRAFRARFPVDDGSPRYCGTCSFRTPEDCDARRLFWLERRALSAPSQP